MISAKEELEKLEQAWYEALRGEDWNLIDNRILADGYVNIDADANAWTKQMDLENCRSGEYRIKDLKLLGLEVDIRNEVLAIVRGQDRVWAHFRGNDVGGTYRWTDVWSKVSGEWRCVASQGSRMPKMVAHILDLEWKWYDAIGAGDWDEVEAILGDEYTNTDAEGHVWTKQEDLANCRSGDYQVAELTPISMEVGGHGENWVTIIGTDRIAARFRFMNVDGVYRWTDTWIRSAGEWRCVASHSCRLVGEASAS